MDDAGGDDKKGSRDDDDDDGGGISRGTTISEAARDLGRLICSYRPTT